MKAQIPDDPLEKRIERLYVTQQTRVAAMSLHDPLASTSEFHGLNYLVSYCCAPPHSGQNLALFGIGLPHSTQNFVSPCGAAGAPAAGDSPGGGAGGTGLVGDGPPGESGLIALPNCCASVKPWRAERRRWSGTGGGGGYCAVFASSRWMAAMSACVRSIEAFRSATRCWYFA